MGKKVKNKKQGGETVKNSSKADKKALLKHTKMLERIGEVMYFILGCQRDQC